MTPRRCTVSKHEPLQESFTVYMGICIIWTYVRLRGTGSILVSMCLTQVSKHMKSTQARPLSETKGNISRRWEHVSHGQCGVVWKDNSGQQRRQSGQGPGFTCENSLGVWKGMNPWRWRSSCCRVKTVELRVHSSPLRKTNTFVCVCVCVCVCWQDGCCPVIIEVSKCLSLHYICGDRDPRIQMLTQAKVHWLFVSVCAVEYSEGEDTRQKTFTQQVTLLSLSLCERVWAREREREHLYYNLRL